MDGQSAGAEKASRMGGPGGSQTLFNPSSADVRLAHGLAVAGLGEDLYCNVCCHYVTQRYHGNPQQLLLNPHRHPRVVSCRDVDSHHHDKNCKHCAVTQEGVKLHPISQSHETSLHRAHLPAYEDRVRQASISMGDHLHLAPHYHPPLPRQSHERLSELQEDLERDAHLAYEMDDSDRYARDASGPVNYSGHGRSFCHGVENPIFTGDVDQVGEWESAADDAVGPHGLSGAERVGRHHGRTRVINSTSVVSSCHTADSGPNQTGQGCQARRRSLSRKALPKVPDVSSINIPSSVSRAWRASCVLLPAPTPSSSDIPTYNNDDDDDSDDEDDDGHHHEETLSLPSSISRFHASRVQFPPLLPDAVYPLTSTKTVYSSPSWLGHNTRGEECPTSSTGGGFLDTLDHYSDNTSMQPNVGSSVTSGAVSDVRENRTMSSSSSEPWGSSMGVRYTPSLTRQNGLTISEGSSNDADTEYTNRQNTGRKVCDQPHRAPADDDADGRGGVGGGADGVAAHHQRGSNYTPIVSDVSDSRVTRTRRKREEAASPNFPRSASELHQARTRHRTGRKERGRKQGFFLIPGQRPKTTDVAGLGGQHETVRERPGASVGVKEPAPHTSLVTPSRRPGRLPINKRRGISVVPVLTDPTLREIPPPPPVPRNSPVSVIVEMPDDSSKSQGRPELPKHSNRKLVQPEKHPSKLFSCALPSAKGNFNQLNAAQTSSDSEKKVRNDVGSWRKTGSENDAFFSADCLIPDLMKVKSSNMSASFPRVNAKQKRVLDTCNDLIPQAVSVDNKTSKATRGKLRKARSQEDYAYVNAGGSFFDEMLQASRKKDFSMSISKSGLASDSLFNNLQRTPVPLQNASHTTAQPGKVSRVGRDSRPQAGSPYTRTESQIIAEVLSSFPQSSVGRKERNENTQPDTVYQDITIPTAFADELFGFWSFSSELDDEISPSQPRSRLMTPLKDEARKANRKFIWGNSSSPSGSTSASSFAPGWQTWEEVAVGARRLNVSQHDPAGDFDDYVEMNTINRHQLDTNSSRMSIGESTSNENIPPTPTWHVELKNVDVINTNDLSKMDEYKGLPLNNLNLSHLYVISGDPEKFEGSEVGGELNNNDRRVLRDTSNIPISNPSRPATGDSSHLLMNSDSPSAALAVVLDGKNVWL